ncbi:MAG TPA: acyl-CoA dehydrogenase family protein [Acidimicrobiales bacterium]|nr:acyl-CoA dehydrogenase family protein [Acidimicrobiales bacterium]
MALTWAAVSDEITSIAQEWRADRTARQQRTRLDPVDFARLADAGFLIAPVPEVGGGLWRSVPDSTRPLCELLRTLGRADSSVALVSSMHPAVLGFWLASPDATRAGWTEQRDAVFASAAAGAQWGTITSEPGSGGDIFRSKSQARPIDDSHALPGATYAISGDKHFGSGSGVASFMITTAVAEGEDLPTVFVFDMRDRPWDGSAGAQLVAEWDGVGMAATQSHAMRFDACPAVRMAWESPIEEITFAAGPLVSNLFTAVVLGVLDEAVDTARRQLEPKAATLRAFEQVEWARAEREHWLAVQAYEGALRTVEAGDGARSLYAALRAKESVAELAESVLSRLARVIGGGTFSRRSPFASWFEDVRALGFLRPPWGLAYDSLFLSSFTPPA